MITKEQVFEKVANEILSEREIERFNRHARHEHLAEWDEISSWLMNVTLECLVSLKISKFPQFIILS
ncbi:hypothetical protein [Bacillus sp. UNCCL81]|uniref:hypothetical protein n=1 Tax=Bacillus sp. UNCCL81 TaxID=1502755 RepID=UPI00041B704A|nr:hypothetical protein [Bacillus sp. UNCCL81]SFD61203.1 hypothetical protein SAMN02799633_04281 [Bacillus sp. UNCCL81]